MNDLENSQTDCARNGVTAEGAEELHPIVERARNLGRSNDCGNRMTVADWLSQNHDIRSHALSLKCVKVRSGTTISGLHLVGDAQPANFPNVTKCRRQIPVRQNDLPTHAGAGLNDERTNLPDCPPNRLDNEFGVFGA